MIYQLFLDQLRIKPAAIAVVDHAQKTYTYQEVSTLVNQWANYLVSQGITAGDRVAVLLDNEDQHLFIFLALDRINACYVPFDTDVPKRQLSLDIPVLGLKKFILDAPIATEFEVDSGLQLLWSQELLASIPNDEPSVPYLTNGFEKTAYIVSSSGSTGAKKWIPILGAGLVYWADSLRHLFHDQPFETLLATRSPGYDARIFEYVLAFSVGAELHLLDRIQRKDCPQILQTCQRDAISGLLLIASQLSMDGNERIIQTLKEAHLKHLFVTGDVCTLQLKALCERYGINLWNCYGPTELTFGLSVLRVNELSVTNKSGQPVVPIGLPIGKDITCHLIDGALCIQSPFLTPGYLTRSDRGIKTISTASGDVRIFDTGDAFGDQDGFLVYEGRHQVDGHCKINGVKVTPYLIEQCIQDYNHEHTETVVQVAVVIKEYMGQPKPFAYVVTPDDFDQAAFLTYLKERLRKEEMPILIRIDALPRLYPSEKIDRLALIAKEVDLRDLLLNAQSNPIDGEINAIHLAVKKIWCELFECHDIALDTEFMFLGGDSLKALTMVNKVQACIDPSYNYVDILKLPIITIQSITESLIKRQTNPQEQALIKPLVCSDERQENMFLLPPLLGEGGFSYRHLANSIAKKFDKNIYGLSDPGILDDALLPSSMAHAVSRYVRAIKSIQPHGPYHLLGFSFGATLAKEVAQQMSTDGEHIAEVHLVDGFPPMVYQALSLSAHAEVLQELLNFVVSILNNHFYGETLAPIRLNLKRFSKLEKSQQLELAFDHLESRVMHPLSHFLLKMAKCHLNLMLSATEPTRKIGIWPTFYLTNTAQPYLNVINQVPGLSKNSADYIYFYWNHYVRNLTRCGLELEGEHLSVLKSSFPGSKRSPEYFWLRSHDRLFNLKVDHYGPASFYRIDRLDHQHDQLAIFFLTRSTLPGLVKAIKALGCTPRAVFHDKILQKYEQKDLIYSAQADLFLSFPHEKLKALQTLMDEHNFPLQRSESRFVCDRKISREHKPSGHVDLMLMWNRSYLLTLSFSYYGLPYEIIMSLGRQLGCRPELSEDKQNILYKHHFIFFDGNVYEAIQQASTFLADFISVLQPHVAVEELGKLL